MPTGPQGQKRPGDLVGCVHRVFQIAIGEAEETPPKDPSKAAAGRTGGKARAKSLTRSKRREIGRQAAAARWG